MKWESSAGGQAPQDLIKNNPLLARVNSRKLYSNGNVMSKEETGKSAHTKRRDKEGLWGCSGSAAVACRSMDLQPEIDLITGDKAGVLLQI